MNLLTHDSSATASSSFVDRRGPRRAAGVAATVYVTAWLVGLSAFGSGPGLEASRRDIIRWFEQHPLSSGVQSLLVHGVAAIALGVVFAAAHRRQMVTRLSLSAAIVAVVLSGVQAGVGLARSVWMEGDSIADAVAVIDRVDGVKMLALAAMAVGLSPLLGRGGRYSPRFAIVTRVTAGALVASGIGYLMDLAVLKTVAYLSLPLLLTWVAMLGATVARGESK